MAAEILREARAMVNQSCPAHLQPSHRPGQLAQIRKLRKHLSEPTSRDLTDQYAPSPPDQDRRSGSLPPKRHSIHEIATTMNNTRDRRGTWPSAKLAKESLSRSAIKKTGDGINLDEREKAQLRETLATFARKGVFGVDQFVNARKAMFSKNLAVFISGDSRIYFKKMRGSKHTVDLDCMMEVFVEELECMQCRKSLEDCLWRLTSASHKKSDGVVTKSMCDAIWSRADQLKDEGDDNKQADRLYQQARQLQTQRWMLARIEAKKQRFHEKGVKLTQQGFSDLAQSSF